MPQLTLDPTADGHFTAWTGGFADVDDGATPDDATTVVSTATNNARESFHFPNVVAGQIPDGSTINSITVHVRARKTVTQAADINQGVYNGTGGPNISEDATPDTLATQNVWEDFTHEIATDPFTAAAWAVDTIRDWGAAGATPRSFGFKSGQARAKEVTRIRIVIDYIAGVPTPTTAALILTTFAPVVTATAHISVVPITAALTLTTFAPTVMATQRKVELANNADYGAATVIVLQTITSWSDTSITFDAVQGGLDAGTVWLFVTRADGTRSAGFAVTLSAGAGVTVTPTTAVLTLTSFAPTVTAPQATVGTLSLVLTARAPTVNGFSAVLNLQVGASDNDAIEDTDGATFVNSSTGFVDAVGVLIGNRFPNIPLPQGTEILSAFFSITIPDSTSDEPQHRLWGELVANAAAFVAGGAGNNNIADRVKTIAFEDWDSADLGAATNEFWTWGAAAGDPTNGADIRAIIQEIIDQPAWAVNNALALLYTQHTDDVLRDLGQQFWDNFPPFAATLVITYTTYKLATPTTAALTLTGFAPAVSVGVRVTPETLALVLTLFAPVVSAPRTATPTTVALTLTTFVPTILAPRTVVPVTAALTITSFVPTIVTPNLVTPTTVSLILTTFAPVIKLGIVPGTAALVLTTFAPVIKLGIIPTTASLVLVTFEPTIVSGTIITPTTAALVITFFAPTIVTPVVATPATASLILTMFAPSVTTGDAQEIVPNIASLVLTSFAPTINITVSAVPGTASLITTMFAPTILLPLLATPTTASLVIALFAPTVLTPRTVIVGVVSLVTTSFIPVISVPIFATPTTVVLTITPFAPIVIVGDEIEVVPDTASLVITTFASIVFTPRTVVPATASLVTTTFAPTVLVSITATPTTASIVITSFVPTVLLPSVVVPATASLILTEFVPVIHIDVILTPSAATLLLVAFVPLIISPQITTPVPAILIITVFAPAVAAASGPQVTPSTATLLLVGMLVVVVVIETITAIQEGYLELNKLKNSNTWPNNVDSSSYIYPMEETIPSGYIDTIEEIVPSGHIKDPSSGNLWDM